MLACRTDPRSSAGRLFQRGVSTARSVPGGVGGKVHLGDQHDPPINKVERLDRDPSLIAGRTAGRGGGRWSGLPRANQVTLPEVTFCRCEEGTIPSARFVRRSGCAVDDFGRCRTGRQSREFGTRQTLRCWKEGGICVDLNPGGSRPWWKTGSAGNALTVSASVASI